MEEKMAEPVVAQTIRTSYGTHVQPTDKGDLHNDVALLTVESAEGSVTYALSAVQAVQMAKDLLAHLG